MLILPHQSGPSRPRFGFVAVDVSPADREAHQNLDPIRIQSSIYRRLDILPAVAVFPGAVGTVAVRRRPEIHGSRQTVSACFT